MNLVKPSVAIVVAALQLASSAYAQTNNSEELQDMSDPLAVYTQAGFGITDKGANIKIGQTYQSSQPGTMAMNIIEMKGIGGELFGIRDNDDPIYANVDDSIDSFRLRNFQVEVAKGLGRQLDVNYDVDNDKLDASYSFIQGLPKFGMLQLFPLAGAGVTIANDFSGDDKGYEIPGTFTVVGMYSKIELTDKIWINYNPMYMHTLSGSGQYKDTYYAGEDNILTHEFALSYQINPRANIRYFANWNEHVNFGDGDHRIEFNYQF
ncbi:hypothetical protein NB525_09345 [Vibrio alginolyticus]|uniref:Porin n=2 Tax=Vibrio alginolyticus TaxID=663 RepID=A0A7Y4EXT6_VIBAL|nr:MULTISPECIES: hypothetical protein [Vibrio]EIC9813780.1 hypothetical protein [Vibrio alginolyticus]EKY4877088.1 hypothetical protein [Vibrio alginolyticus]EKY4879082.1 hypothetical protein [Vibrio alginolyticus]MBS9898569.1 hypothetical protein [Vibrio alginolyticus]MBS9920581.1 hypothetical protein [Vibrio alginolyticus]